MIARSHKPRRRVAPRGKGSRCKPGAGTPKQEFFERLAYRIGCSVAAVKRAWELGLL